MPRKKRTVAPEPVVSEKPELPMLTQEEILRLRLLDAESRLAAQEARNTGFERQAYLARVDPQGRIAQMDSEIRDSFAREAESRRNYQALLDSAGKRLGLDLRAGCTIDPETGTVTVLEKKE